MKTLALALLAAPFAPFALAAADPSPIFNGKDLSGWKCEPNLHWKAAGGVLVGQSDPDKKGSLLLTEKDYGDFTFETEVRWAGEIDSGVLFRKPQLQVQFGVSRSLKKDMTCAFYTGGKDKYPEAGHAKGIDRLLKAGDWNTVRIRAKGTTFTVWLNGEKVSEFSDPKYTDPAPIGLQVHGGLDMKVEFRNIRIAAE
ncbi:MAG: DUF1080 domain-containing protein [Verrucomicrobiae bacterium]|nr:DUF1080 domain-containing protein [Verrucomicrobiae bacterium]